MSHIPELYWLGAGVFLAVTLGTLSVALLWEWIRETTGRRSLVRNLRELSGEPARDPAVDAALLRVSPATRSEWLAALTEVLPPLRNLSELLQQAEVSWSATTFVLVSVGPAAGLGFGVYLATRSAGSATLIAGIALLVPTLLLMRRRSRQLALTEEQLPEALELLSRAIRAGHPLSAGLKMVADEAPLPIATHFRRVFEEQRFGLPIEDSLMALIDRVPLVDFRIFVTAVLIQREVGGNLAEILDNMSRTVRSRFTLRRQVRVYTAQGRMSGYILALLPPAVALVLYGLNRVYIVLLFTDPLGRAMLATALLLQLLGFFWIRQIVDIEV